MTREEKTVAIESLKSRLNEVDYFYLTDSSTLTVDQVNKFRRLCFEKGVEMKVVKNTLMQSSRLLRVVTWNISNAMAHLTK